MNLRIKGRIETDGITVDPRDGVELMIYNVGNSDIGDLLDYYYDQAWDDSRPIEVLFQLARVKYPELGPFTIPGEENEKDITEQNWSVSEYRRDCFYMYDVRDKNGQMLPRE